MNPNVGHELCVLYCVPKHLKLVTYMQGTTLINDDLACER